jgi:hypothetical protein
MSARDFRKLLSPADQAALDWTLASRMDPQAVFDLTVLDLIGKGARLRRSRLAVAISKTDLIAGTRALAWHDGNDQEQVRAWLSTDLGLGNLVRSMDQNFREVRFFFTASVMSAPGEVHESISPLVSWTLGTQEPGPPD